MQITQKAAVRITMQTKGHGEEIELAEMDCEGELQAGGPRAVGEVRSRIGELMRVGRLTRPDLAFGSAAAARKYGESQDPNSAPIERARHWEKWQSLTKQHGAIQK